MDYFIRLKTEGCNKIYVCMIVTSPPQKWVGTEHCIQPGTVDPMPVERTVAVLVLTIQLWAQRVNIEIKRF